MGIVSTLQAPTSAHTPGTRPGDAPAPLTGADAPALTLPSAPASSGLDLIARPVPSHGRSNGWIVLDRAWASRLGVSRDAGIYRIRRRDLVDRLTHLAGHTGGVTARAHVAA
jgi:hypothetical protein